MRKILTCVAALLCAAAVVGTASASTVHGYRIIAKLPHSTRNYTEGFFYRDGLFYEGTGLDGLSAVVVTVPETGKVVRSVDIPERYFGEGIVDWGPYLYEWTWKSHTGFVYNRSTLKQVRQFSYSGEGWGMTRTATEIVTSDGSSTLRLRNPDTFEPTREIVVRDGDRPVALLNELEYIDGLIYANVWHSDRIARISPRNGRVVDWIDCSGLLPDDQKINAESVLNGIAYDAKHHRLFVTGKQWPSIFEIKIK